MAEPPFLSRRPNPPSDDNRGRNTTLSNYSTIDMDGPPVSPKLELFSKAPTTLIQVGTALNLLGAHLTFLAAVPSETATTTTTKNPIHVKRWTFFPEQYSKTGAPVG